MRKEFFRFSFYAMQMLEIKSWVRLFERCAIRTRDLRLRRPTLYPAELIALMMHGDLFGDPPKRTA